MGCRSGCGRGVGEGSFRRDRIPCRALTGFNLARRVVRSLPVRTLSSVDGNHPSPMLPIDVRMGRNCDVGDEAQFTLIEVTSNDISIVFCPILGCTPLSGFAGRRRRLLGRNGTIITSISVPSNTRIGTFMRVSKRAGRIVTIPAPIVNEGLRILSSRLDLKKARLGDVRGNRTLAFTMRSRPIAMNVSLADSANVHFTGNSNRR